MWLSIVSTCLKPVLTGTKEWVVFFIMFFFFFFFLYLLPTEGGFKLPELIRKQFNDYFWKVKVHMIRQFHFHFENMVYFYCFWKRRLKLCLHLAEISLCDWLGIWLLEHLSLNSWDSDVALSRSQWGENR